METKDMKPADFYKADGTFDWASFWKQQFDRASEQVTFLGTQVKFLLEQKTADNPKREWVGLTNEELVEIRETHQAHIFNLMFAVEAKVREKNDAI